MSDDEPKLLRIPQHFKSVDEVLAVAKQLDLPNVLVLSMREDGKLIFLDSDIGFAEANWLLDRMKAMMLFERRNT